MVSKQSCFVRNDTENLLQRIKAKKRNFFTQDRATNLPGIRKTCKQTDNNKKNYQLSHHQISILTLAKHSIKKTKQKEQKNS